MRNRLLTLAAVSTLLATPAAAMSFGEFLDHMAHDAQAIFSGEPTTQELGVTSDDEALVVNGSNGDGPSTAIGGGSMSASANGASASISSDGSMSASANGASASISSDGSMTASTNGRSVSIGPGNGNGNAWNGNDFAQ